ncbi:MAG: cell division protein ZipA [Gammaproteobacteria bacterium]|nr:cell division protein ZipA [Gammaproteobacteria bacterium]
MDIKNYILIGGGLLIAAVVAHGFWLAYRSRRDPLRLDIAREIPVDDDVDDITLLRGELPNGGARVVGRRDEPLQEAFELEPPPMLIESESKPAPVPRDDLDTQPFEFDDAEIVAVEPRGTVPSRVEMRTGIRDGMRAAPSRSKPLSAENLAAGSDLLVITVLARDEPFTGSDLVDVFLGNGLKFGDMNIFHRVDLKTKAAQFSVVNAVEPGTFDLSAMDEIRTPGISFFLQLPGPAEPGAVFEDMLAVARDVAETLGGDLKDENLSVMTAQNIEHCRQRIAEFSRKLMSARA